MNLRRNDLWRFTVPILLFTAWLGARGLNEYALWFDEYYSIFESGGAYYGPLSPLQVISRVATSTVWPPAYDLSLAGWGALVGWSPVAGRALSWLLGLLALAVVYRLARLLFPNDKVGALTAVVLMGGSAFYIYYFHELRGYSLHILIGCSAAALYWHLLKRSFGRPAQITFAASLTLLLYSHPVGQLWFAVFALFHIIFERRSARWKPIFFLFFIAGLLYVPWIAVMMMRVSKELTSPRGFDPIMMLGIMATSYTNWLTVIVGGLCALTLRRLREKPIQFLWWWLVGVLVLMLLVNRFVPFLYHIRLYMAVLPALLLLTAAGLGELRRLPWLQIGLAAAWLMMGIYLVFRPSFMRDLPGALRTVSWPGFEAALKTLNKQASTNDAILFRVANASEENWFNPPLQYYLHGSPLHFSLLSIVNEHSDHPFDERLRTFVDDSPRVWVAVVPDIAPDNEISALSSLLSKTYTLCPRVIDLPDMHLDLYVRRAVADCSASATG